MRLSEDVIRYMTVKQEGSLPTPRPSSKNTTQAENEENKDTPSTNNDSQEKQPATVSDASIAVKDDTETKDKTES